MTFWEKKQIVIVSFLGKQANQATHFFGQKDYHHDFF